MKSPFAAAFGAALLTLCAAAHAAGPNLLVNGSFESGLASWTTAGFTLQGYDYGIDSDAHSGASAFYGGGIDQPGFLRQTFSSVAGQVYDLDFWLKSDGFLTNAFQVIANGQVLLSLEDLLLQPYGARHVSFTAAGASTQLEFGFRDDSGALHFDDVTVSVSAVPEPVTSALLVLGLGAIAARRRASRRSA
jgi:hypothetical protein